MIETWTITQQISLQRHKYHLVNLWQRMQISEAASNVNRVSVNHGSLSGRVRNRLFDFLLKPQQRNRDRFIFRIGTKTM